jgi:hypothetical protein
MNCPKVLNAYKEVTKRRQLSQKSSIQTSVGVVSQPLIWRLCLLRKPSLGVTAHLKTTYKDSPQNVVLIIWGYHSALQYHTILQRLVRTQEQHCFHVMGITLISRYDR